MKKKNDIIKEMVKEDMKDKVSSSNIYNKIRNKLNLNSIQEDIIQLYKDEINHRMDLFFYGESDQLSLSLDFDNFYKEMLNSDKFKYKKNLLIRLQKAYESSVNFSCLNIFHNYNQEKKLYNLYNVLTIEELNKLKN